MATQKRYLALAVIAAIWMLVQVGVNRAVGGSPGLSIATLAWALVVYDAAKGNAQGIKTTAKFITILQIVGGGILIFLSSEGYMQAFFGPPELLLIGLALPTLSWIVLYIWANSKLGRTNAGIDAISNDQAVRPVSMFKEPGQTVSSQDFGSLLEVKDRLSQVTETVRTERQNDAPSNISNVDEASNILLKYNDDARAAYIKLNQYPVEWQNEYKQRLVENSAQDPEALIGIVALKFLRRTDLAWSTELWDALESTRTYSKAAFNEFVSVFGLLSLAMEPKVIASKVIENNTVTITKKYSLLDGSGEKRTIFRYSDGSFAVMGISTRHPSIEGIYDYLEVGHKDRYPVYFLTELD